jgi:hypothetical protein
MIVAYKTKETRPRIIPLPGRSKNKMTEIIYTHPDGREEVCYSYSTNSPDALEMISQLI